MKIDEVLLKIQKDDVLTSKKGFLFKSPISKEWYICKKVKYSKEGFFVVIGEKEEVNVKDVLK